MRKISTLLIMISLFSCNYKIYPPKDAYSKPPFIYKSDKSFQEVWDNVIDFFAQKGIAISLIDKSSGLIISVQTDMIWSSENRKTNKMKKPDAWVVLNNIYDPAPNKYRYPERVSGKWNVRVKPEGEKCTINVNLHDLIVYDYSYTRTGIPVEVAVTQSYNPTTTGNFEKLIYDIIK